MELKINKYVTLIAILSLLVSCKREKSLESVFLIPKNFEGVVVVLFNDSNGSNEEYDNSKRIFRIPNDGILRTKINPTNNDHKSFFNIDSNGNKIQIPYVAPIDLKQHNDSLKLIVFNLENTVNIYSGKKRYFQTFIVTKIHHLDSISKIRSRKVWNILSDKAIFDL